jgi:hypothetical protein
MMKKGMTFLFSLVLMSTVLVMDSCKKDRIRGCTDPDSTNYDEFANKDDGSCRYEGFAVIWYDEAASAGLTEDGATALTFYLNEEVIGSSAASVFWAAAPDCGDNGSISITEDMGKDKTKNYTLSVKDQDGFEYWTTTLTLQGNICLALELTWDSRKKK